MSESLVGRTGMVTGAIAPGVMGEVMIRIRGGSEAFNAYGVDDQHIALGTQIHVVDQITPRTLLVSAL